MSRWPGLALVLCLGACASGSETNPSGAETNPSGKVTAAANMTASGNPGLTSRQAVRVDGQIWDVGQLTESTWSAVARPSSGTPQQTSTAQQTALLKEIERMSKCRVANSEYSREGKQLDAQVDCARRLQN